MSKPKLYIVGLQEPITITELEAQVIQNLKSDDSKSPSTPIVIEGVWAGAKKDVKYIKFPEKEVSYNKREIPALTDAEADLYEKKIFPYQLEAELSGFGTYLWKLFYSQATGASRLDLVHDHQGKERLVEVVTDPKLYPKVQDEIEAYIKWTEKKKFIEKQEAKRLEALAETLTEAELDYESEVTSQ